MPYKVTKQYGRGLETIAQRFKNIDEAKRFMLQSAESDAAMKVQCVYRLYDFDDVIDTLDSTKIDLSSKTTDSSDAGSQGKTSSATFRPSPLQTTPRPPGMPANNWSTDDKDKNDKEDK